MSNNFFTVCSLFYSLMLFIIYFRRENSKTLETRIYSSLVIANFLNVVMAVLCYFTIIMNEVYPFLNNFISKTLLVFYTAWMLFFTLYVFTVTRKYEEEKIEEKINKKKTVIAISYIILAIAMYVAPLYYHNIDKVVYSYGPAANITYVLAAILIVCWIVMMIRNYKILRNKKCIPIVLFIFLTVIAVAIQKTNPGLLLITAVETFITIIMYFTIENPDVKMNAMLLRNRELLEQTVNDKSNFLFKVSQEVKKPLQTILKDIKSYNSNFTTEETKELLQKIEANANNVYFITNDIASISSMDVKKIKMQENKYKTEKFFKELEINTKNNLIINNKNENIDFNFKILNSYPEYLCGDNIKLKQILLSLISNSIKYTKKGFIDIEIDAISRYDVCRLIFTIKDSGCGMSLSKVNDLLSSNIDIDTIDFQNIDNLSLNIPMIIKIIKLLGGSISIKSDEGKGTIFVIVIDQKIEDAPNEELEKAKKYNTGKQKKQRVLIADDSDNIDKIKRLISKYDVDIVTTLVGKDVVDKIKTGDNYNLIIIKDEMSPDNAYTVLKELQKIKKFSIPVAIMINKEKEFIKEHFIKDGFSDYIMINNIDSEIEKVCNKYL